MIKLRRNNSLSFSRFNSIFAGEVQPPVPKSNNKHFLCFRIWFRYNPNLLSDVKINELEIKLNHIKDDVELVSKRLNSIGFDYQIEFRRIATNSFPIININITRRN